MVRMEDGRVVTYREVVQKNAPYGEVVVIDYHGERDQAAITRVAELADEIVKVLIASSMDAKLVQIGPEANVDAPPSTKVVHREWPGRS